MSASVEIEAVSATCAECSWGKGPYDNLFDAQEAAHEHNQEHHLEEDDV